ncbi:MAG: nitroreductase [Alphaproteobacteria bacterium]|nr:nitroreductase [Alphaproteobacteria bacterium]
MPQARPEVLDFLLTRRSRPAKTLRTPVPDHAALMPMLTAAARSPDHGKLEPWRFIVLEGAALTRLQELTAKRGAELALEPDKLDKACRQFGDADLVVAVISAPVISQKVAEVEQILSAGAVCLALLNAALASGWGANWLTGWMASDRAFLETGFGLAPHEFVAGYIHMGTETHAPPERPRPVMVAKIAWLSE